IPDPQSPRHHHRTRKTSCTTRAVLSPSRPVSRKLSELVPTDAFDVNVPPVAVAPPGPLVFHVVPRPGAGLKYGVLNALSSSPRNSKFTLPLIGTRLLIPMSNRTRRGPFTTSERMPQSP